MVTEPHDIGFYTILISSISRAPEQWDTHMSLAEFSLNSVVSDSTGFSPFKLMYGYEPLTPCLLQPLSVHCHIHASGSARQVQAAAEMLDSMTAS